MNYNLDDQNSSLNKSVEITTNKQKSTNLGSPLLIEEVDEDENSKNNQTKKLSQSAAWSTGSPKKNIKIDKEKSSFD